MKEDLLPCPFCGSPVEIESTYDNEIITCTLCPARMDYEGSHSAAIAMWNTRTTHDRWISTAERLPDKDMACLIVYRRETYKAVWNDYHKCWDDHSGDDYWLDPEVPTHWRPIPKPPESLT
ncbi:MAG: Lar family restriction alleviation protein [Spirochaetales bacterium]|nr:Lar family restriction alleviation protein [Spirochaetales bacterium]